MSCLTFDRGAVPSCYVNGMIGHTLHGRVINRELTGTTVAELRMVATPCIGHQGVVTQYVTETCVLAINATHNVLTCVYVALHDILDR